MCPRPRPHGIAATILARASTARSWQKSVLQCSPTPTSRGLKNAWAMCYRGAIFANSLERLRTIFVISPHNSANLADSSIKIEMDHLHRRFQCRGSTVHDIRKRSLPSHQKSKVHINSCYVFTSKIAIKQVKKHSSSIFNLERSRQA